MRKENYKGRTEKRKVSKCAGLCVTYDGLHKKLTDMLAEDKGIKEFRCNVLMDGVGYTSDVVATAEDGHLIVYECAYRKTLIRPSVGKLLDLSREYWMKHGNQFSKISQILEDSSKQSSIILDSALFDEILVLYCFSRLMENFRSRFKFCWIVLFPMRQ